MDKDLEMLIVLQIPNSPNLKIQSIKDLSTLFTKTSATKESKPEFPSSMEHCRTPMDALQQQLTVSSQLWNDAVLATTGV